MRHDSGMKVPDTLDSPPPGRYKQTIQCSCRSLRRHAMSDLRRPLKKLLATWSTPATRAGLAPVLFALAMVIGGCGNPIYWTRADATPEIFLTDHEACFDAAFIGY